ncbi:MAG: ferritin [Schleiferiaceae bacterium]|jgi:ferritin|nr:ferritin [Schleiferiaceae bacterium]
MLSKTIEKALNNQLKIEAYSSHVYLAMASWAENQGFPGIANFLYSHSDEERMHMLKLVRYINERGGSAVIPELEKPSVSFDGITQLFESLLEHEKNVTVSINEVVHECLEEKDYSTHNFMQWYVAEQLEEEALAHDIIDKLKLIGGNAGGLYMFDRDVATFHQNIGNGE